MPCHLEATDWLMDSFPLRYLNYFLIHSLVSQRAKEEKRFPFKWNVPRIFLSQMHFLHLRLLFQGIFRIVSKWCVFSLLLSSVNFDFQRIICHSFRETLVECSCVTSGYFFFFCENQRLALIQFFATPPKKCYKNSNNKNWNGICNERKGGVVSNYLFICVNTVLGKL